MSKSSLRAVLSKFYPLTGDWQTVSLMSNVLSRAEKKRLIKHLRHIADKAERLIEKEERAEHADKHYRCKICGSSTKQLKTTDGDPEGIRHDRICTNPKCKRKHGMTKAHFFAFHLYKTRGGKGTVEAP